MKEFFFTLSGSFPSFQAQLKTDSAKCPLSHHPQQVLYFPGPTAILLSKLSWVTSWSPRRQALLPGQHVLYAWHPVRCLPLMLVHAHLAQSWLTLCHPMSRSPPGSLSMGFPRQEYWSGLPFPFPMGLPDPGIKPASPALAGGLFTTEPPGKPPAYL